MSWRDDKPTEKQISAIMNMSSALDRKYKAPKNKGEASDMIGKLKKIIETNVGITGLVAPHRSYSYNEDDEAEDDFTSVMDWG